MKTVFVVLFVAMLTIPWLYLVTRVVTRAVLRTLEKWKGDKSGKEK